MCILFFKRFLFIPLILPAAPGFSRLSWWSPDETATTGQNSISESLRELQLSTHNPEPQPALKRAKKRHAVYLLTPSITKTIFTFQLKHLIVPHNRFTLFIWFKLIILLFFFYKVSYYTHTAQHMVLYEDWPNLEIYGLAQELQVKKSYVDAKMYTLAGM